MVAPKNRPSFSRIILRINWSGLFAVFVYAFLQTYAEFIYALTLTTDVTSQPMTVEVSRFISNLFTNWEMMMAYTSLLSLPILVLFALSQRILLRGLIAGSVKQ